MSELKFTILGFKNRGLWLASELAKKKWDVTWMNIQNNQEEFSDFPWQLGTQDRFSSLDKSLQTFIKNIYTYKNQSGLQIITRSGPLEMRSEFTKQAMSLLFRETKDVIQKYFDAIHSKKTALIEAFEKKLLKLPLSKRWLIEWLTSLPSNSYTQFKNISNYNHGKRIDPESDYLYFDDSLREATQKAVSYAENSGVKLIQDAKILDIGLDGSKVSGVEIEHVKGFVPCDHLILCSPAGYLHDRWPHVAKKMTEGQILPKLIWFKFSMEVKPQAKPLGLLPFSSYVIDPCIPFEGSNFGLLMWPNNNVLDVWCRISFEEAKKASVLKNISAEIKNHLFQLLPQLEGGFVKMLPYDEEITAVKNRFLYGEDQRVIRGLYKKNLWFAGPETDRGLDLISSFETEQSILNAITKKYIKEPKGDRKIHSPSNGEAVVSGT